MEDIDNKFQHFLSGLGTLSARAKERLLAEMQEEQPTAVPLLQKVYANEEITAAEQVELLTVLKVHSDNFIRWFAIERARRALEESPRQADESRIGPSAERRGGRKPSLDDYDRRPIREIGKFKR